MPSDYSDLIVVEKTHHEEKQVCNEGTESSQRTHNGSNIQELPATPQEAPERRKISLKSKTFRIAAVFILVVITTAVGGGVGGALSHRDNNNNNKTITASSKSSATQASTTQANTTQASATTFSSSSASNTHTPLVITPPTSEPPPPTTTEVAGPQTTLLRDCPSSNNTIYRVDYAGKPRFFRKICNSAFLNSIDNKIINIATPTLDDCINQCAGYNMEEMDKIRTGQGSVCNAVCWQNTFDTDWPGQCFGYATQNSTEGGFEMKTHGEACDSAAWINQSFD